MKKGTCVMHIFIYRNIFGNLSKIIINLTYYNTFIDDSDK